MASTPEVRAGHSRPVRRWALRALLVAAAAVAMVFGVIVIYANFINDPEDALTEADLQAALVATTEPDPLIDTAIDEPDPATDPAEDPTATNPAATAVTTTTTVTTTTAGGAIPVDPGVEGRWVATADSEVGYRVTEVLFGVNTEGVGRTNEVEGELVIDGTTITAVEFAVDLGSVTSDDGRRDGQFRGRIMNVNQFPTATFALTEPIELGEIPAPGEQITATATGDLTLRGTTNEVVFDVVAQRSQGRIGVLGAIGVVFAEYQIPNPSIAGITTEDNGLLEFVLVFTRP